MNANNSISNFCNLSFKIYRYHHFSPSQITCGGERDQVAIGGVAVCLRVQEVGGGKLYVNYLREGPGQLGIKEAEILLAAIILLIVVIVKPTFQHELLNWCQSDVEFMNCVSDMPVGTPVDVH